MVLGVACVLGERLEGLGAGAIHHDGGRERVDHEQTESALFVGEVDEVATRDHLTELSEDKLG